MIIIIPIFIFLLSFALSQSPGSKCLRMTRENFTLRDRNIIIDMTSFAIHYNKENHGDELYVIEGRMKKAASMLSVWKNFSLFYCPTGYYIYLNNWKETFSLEVPFAGIFNSTTSSEKYLASISTIAFSGSRNATSNFGETLEDIVYSSNESISQVLKVINSTDVGVGPYPKKLGLVTPLLTTGNESICDVSEDELLKLLGFFDQIFIGPIHCRNESSVEECVEEVIQTVENCSDQVNTKMSTLNHSGFLPLGISTSTTFFEGDYLARGKYWCLISEYAEKTKRQVIMLDEDDFFRKHVQGLLTWDAPDNTTNTTSFEDEPRNIFTTPAFISGAVVVGAIVLFVLFLLHSGNQKRLLSKREAKEFFDGKSNESGWLGLGYNKELEILKEDIFLDNENILGSGAFGCVYGGYISVNGVRQDVAIKTMKNISESVSTLKGLCSEIKVLSHLGTHEHIVCLVGAYTAELEKGIVYVIMEMCSRGSLERYLQLLKNPEDDQYLTLVDESSPSENFSRRESLETSGNEEEQLLIRFSREICSGVEYLSGKNVIHGDLATRNVLLTSNLQAKISDFGLSRRLYEYTKYVKKQEEPLPWKWMAPEALTKLEFSEQSDVWSFGVTIWEIFSFGNTPYPGLGWRLDFTEELEKGLRLEMPDGCPQHFYEMMLTCWCFNPKARPTFSQLKERLMLNK